MREVLFKSINAKIEGATFYYQKTTELAFLSEWNVSDLNQLKLGLTLLFTIVFITFTFLGLKYSHPENKSHLFAFVIYGSIIILALLLLVMAYIFDSFQTFYPYLRILVGFVHNPLIYILVSAGIIGSNALSLKK